MPLGWLKKSGAVTEPKLSGLSSVCNGLGRGNMVGRRGGGRRCMMLLHRETEAYRSVLAIP